MAGVKLERSVYIDLDKRDGRYVMTVNRFSQRGWDYVCELSPDATDKFMHKYLPGMIYKTYLAAMCLYDDGTWALSIYSALNGKMRVVKKFLNEDCCKCWKALTGGVEL